MRNYTQKRNPIFQQKKPLNQKGQSLIEYLILVALMGVATIGIVRTLQSALNSRYASVIHSLQGNSKRAPAVEVNETDLKKKDLGDFMNGAASKDGN